MGEHRLTLIGSAAKPARLEISIRIDPGNQVAVDFPPDELVCYRMLFTAAMMIAKKFDEQKKVVQATGGDLSHLPPPPGGDGNIS